MFILCFLTMDEKKSTPTLNIPTIERPFNHESKFPEKNHPSHINSMKEATTMKFSRFRRLVEDTPASPVIPSYQIRDVDGVVEVISARFIPAGQNVGEYATKTIDGEDVRSELANVITRSDTPNCELGQSGDRTMVTARTDIEPGSALTVEYEPSELSAVGHPRIDLPPELFDELKEMLAVGPVQVAVDNPSKHVPGEMFTTPWGDTVRVEAVSEYSITLVGYIAPVDGEGDTWRIDTGIEILDPEGSPEEIEHRWLNWQLMNSERQSTSDEKAKERHGNTNAEIAEIVKTKVVADAVPALMEKHGIPMLEDMTYYNLRNFLMLLKTKVSKAMTKDIIEDIIRALMNIEVRNIPLFKLQQLTVPPRTLPR